jgi:hypothetical protein
MIRLKLWAAGMAAAVAALLSIWFGGRMSGKSDAKAAIAENRAKAVRAANEVENEVEALSTDDLRRRTSVWVRNRKQR